ncbi:cell wall assembly and cell proliferation coordinating protein [Suhomyces tanzawaensis NRRL Y-17324]|uniref:Cell wall assembly and cell proliferation coordinating protein n=1 Tax=Suhomyces tanzawaensis NRRL Y-17324 TaxID=984487 RepID=A0A1E4SDE5_9ASCO|nr:cell wall assembly and cell proliferation coordinating protein [Suhomyces tanzawaensis NRRL Y-17324]ODV77534.1 cell wall assembly and cell proliferation coordinating protein [Suhomyces tanzawaensis NRRL Y-17324]
MGLLDNFKAFLHSITTEDHYASYDSPYKNSVINNSGSIVGGGNDRDQDSGSRLHELNRLATVNSSTNSLIGGNNSSSNVGYRPGLRSSSNANSTTDLPMQNLNANGQPPLPSMDSLWDRIEHWIEEEYPELEDYLNDGVTTADLNEFENDLGCGSLPAEFRQFYKRHDGQFRGGRPTGLILGLALLDLEGIAEEYAVWGKVAQRLERQQYLAQNQQLQGTSSANQARSNNFMANQRSIPPNAVQSTYYHKAWIPILKDHIGNQIAIDLSPGPNGNWGQMIIFGRDFDTKLVIAGSFVEFIYNYVTDLDAGNFSIDSSETREDQGFLSSSRDDEYGIGDEDEDQGELTFHDPDGKEFGKGAFKGEFSYIEVLKKRALKKYGLTENFETAFTPASVSIKKSKNPLSGVSTPLRSLSPSLSLKNNNSKSALINLENTSKVALPKETLIDDKVESPKDAKEEPKKEEPKKETPKQSKKQQSKKQQSKKEQSKEDVAKVDALNEVSLNEEEPSKEQVKEDSQEILISEPQEERKLETAA